MQLTNKQLGAICYFLKSEYPERLADYEVVYESGTRLNAPYVGAKRWIEVNVDFGTAKDIIGIIDLGHKELAFNQLSHLGLPIKH